MKAISTVIASILMLMIVVALGGTTYLYISGIFTGRTATAFEIIDAINDTVIIRNSGTEQITSFSSTIVDGNPAVYRVSAQDSSLVGYWKMDESTWINDCTTKSVKDSSGKGNDGKACPDTTGPTGGATGRFGNAGSFDGVNDYVNVGAPANGSLDPQEITIEAWLKTTQTSAGRIVWKWAADTSGSYLLSLGDITTGKIRFIIRNSATDSFVLDSPTAVNNNGWHHVVGTYNMTAEKMRFYIDGVLDQEKTATSSMQTNAIGLAIGATDGGGTNFNGTIDEVRIYNRALSEQEIKAHYNIGSQINPGEIATIKIYNTISKGTHTLRLCTSSMCNTVYLTIN